TGSDEDLPRTLRRAKAEQAAARSAAEPGSAASSGHTSSSGSARASSADTAFTAEPDPYRASPDTNAYAQPYAGGLEPDDRVTVTKFDVPFFSLMSFFLKAILAAIPALILLGVILWGGGQVLKALFPWLLQAEILIRLPNS
ncbi:MAG: hypothetical protein AAFR55_04360, partial [Pseudomonadota bacterium]